MENMLHSSPSHTTVPSCFILPSRHLKPATSDTVSLPIVDLSCTHDEVFRAILDTGKDFVFFQVVNHGVSEQAMRDMEAVCKEFFELPVAEKAGFYSEDTNNPNRLFSGTVFKTGDVRCFPEPYTWSNKSRPMEDLIVENTTAHSASTLRSAPSLPPRVSPGFIGKTPRLQTENLV
ncbi:unnamed protein product [Urochloa humidicola]